ncbi:hypothetical protein SAMN04515617_109216 [Collimonas sp. OK242]|nr:hypothetical protein SAMN04515617_109216 [Collimonas sp. OK242]SFC03443.1 hypothetical protein SAMN04515619_10443 [Collimonas sp. OK412]
MSVFQLDSKCCIGEILKNLALHLDNVVFCHSVYWFLWSFISTYRVETPPLKFALRSSESYCCDIT